MAKYTWFMDRERAKPRHWEVYFRYLGIPTPKWMDRRAHWLVDLLKVCGLVRCRKHPSDPYYDR
jgi:hypothetical protein